MSNGAAIVAGKAQASNARSQENKNVASSFIYGLIGSGSEGPN